MAAVNQPILHHRTGVPSYDSALWSCLPSVDRTHRHGEAWSVLVQDPPDPAGSCPGVETLVPELDHHVLFLVLDCAPRLEGIISGTGAARPLSLRLRRGDVLLIPAGVPSRWMSPSGAEQVVHLHLHRDFLGRLGIESGLPSRAGNLPFGRLRDRRVAAPLLRQLGRELRRRPLAWERMAQRVVTLLALDMLAGGTR